MEKGSGCIKNGEMVEIKPLTINLNGIQFNVGGFSPFVLAAEPVSSSSGVVGNVPNVIISSQEKSPKTGDAGSVAVLKAFTQSL